MFFVLFLLFLNDFSLDKIIEIAKERSPYLLSLKKEIEAREEEILPSSALPDPMLDVMYQNIGFDNFSYGKEEMSMLSFNIKQNLLYPGKRKAAKEVAEAKKEISYYFYKIAEAEVVKRIREIWAALYSFEKEKEGLQAGIELLDLIKTSLSASISSGTSPVESYLKLEILKGKLKAEVLKKEQEISLFIEELSRISSFDFENIKIENLPNLVLDANFKEKAFLESPQIKYFKFLLKLQEKELEEQKLALKPNFSLISGIGLRGGMDPAITVGTSIELPFWKKEKQIPLIYAKESEKNSYEKMLEDAILKVKEDLEKGEEILKNSEERLKVYNESYLQNSSSAIEAALALFISSKGDFSTVVEDINLWIEGKVEIAKIEAEKFIAKSKILYHLNR